MRRTCSTPGCQRIPRPGYAICDADVLDLVAPAPRPTQQPDLADPPLGAIASRDEAAGSPEAPCPAASPATDPDSRFRVGSAPPPA